MFCWCCEINDACILDQRPKFIKVYSVIGLSQPTPGQSPPWCFHDVPLCTNNDLCLLNVSPFCSSISFAASRAAASLRQISNAWLAQSHFRVTAFQTTKVCKFNIQNTTLHCTHWLLNVVCAPRFSDNGRSSLHELYHASEALPEISGASYDFLVL